MNAIDNLIEREETNKDTKLKIKKIQIKFIIKVE